MEEIMVQVWRHPRPEGVTGRCIGLTDVPVDARRAKRLAHRIRSYARQHLAPRMVWTSPLQRSAQVGRWLARWGWCHRMDARLMELDFGHWDGRLWASIGAAAVDEWCSDFGRHAPGGGECVQALMDRSASFLRQAGLPNSPRMILVVGHAGWINAARWSVEGRQAPLQGASWPPAVAYGSVVSLRAPAAACNERASQ